MLPATNTLCHVIDDNLSYLLDRFYSAHPSMTIPAIMETILDAPCLKPFKAEDGWRAALCAALGEEFKRVIDFRPFTPEGIAHLADIGASQHPNITHTELADFLATCIKPGLAFNLSVPQFLRLAETAAIARGQGYNMTSDDRRLRDYINPRVVMCRKTEEPIDDLTNLADLYEQIKRAEEMLAQTNTEVEAVQKRLADAAPKELASGQVWKRFTGEVYILTQSPFPQEGFIAMDVRSKGRSPYVAKTILAVHRQYAYLGMIADLLKEGVITTNHTPIVEDN